MCLAGACGLCGRKERKRGRERRPGEKMRRSYPKCRTAEKGKNARLKK